MQRNMKGFTLIEMMIVVAIIGLLAAIAIPNLLRARMDANEGLAKQNIRTFSSANESYRAAQVIKSYAGSISDLTAAAPNYLDTIWDANPFNGFTTTYASAATTYSMLMTPVDSTSSSHQYCVDQTGILYIAESGMTGTAVGCAGGTPIATG